MLAGLRSRLRARWPSIRSQVHERTISFGQPRSQRASFLILSNSGGAECAARSGSLLQDAEKRISITAIAFCRGDPKTHDESEERSHRKQEERGGNLGRIKTDEIEAVSPNVGVCRFDSLILYFNRFSLQFLYAILLFPELFLFFFYA